MVDQLLAVAGVVSSLKLLYNDPVTTCSWPSMSYDKKGQMCLCGLSDQKIHEPTPIVVSLLRFVIQGLTSLKENLGVFGGFGWQEECSMWWSVDNGGKLLSKISGCWWSGDSSSSLTSIQLMAVDDQQRTDISDRLAFSNLKQNLVDGRPENKRQWWMTQ